MHVCLEDRAALLHFLVVLLDEEVGHVVLGKQNQIGQVVNHGQLVFVELLPRFGDHRGFALLERTHPRCLPRIVIIV